jgi:hypothetical protein
MTTGRGRWGLAALFAVAAVVATVPAVGGLTSEFMTESGEPGYGEAASGDHLQTTYRFWLVGHQLERGEAPWIDPYSFQPLIEPQAVLGGWPFGLPFWPLDELFGPVVAWNLLLLAVTFAAGLFVYLWLRELELPPLAAALGGVAFELAPYRLLQSGGHLLGWAAVFVPLTLWAFERSRRAGSERAAHLWGVLAAAGVVSIPLSGQLHLALGALPFVAVYAALRYGRTASLWAWGGVLAGAATGLVAEAAIISDSTESEGRTLAEVAFYSASPADLLSRWRLHEPERFVYLGWLLPILAITGLVLLARRRRRGLAILLGLAALVPALLALGTNLPLYETLRDVFPPLRYPRVPGRFLPLANLALAALAAVAAASLIARFDGRRRAAAAAVVLVLVAADLLVFPLRSSEADPGNEAYTALAASPTGRVLELPIFQRGKGQFGSVYDYYTLQAPRERPTGYALAPEEVFEFTERFNRLDCGAWLQGDREELERLGIRSIVWHGGLYAQSKTPGAPFAWEGLRRSGLGAVAGRPPVVLFRPGPDTGRPPFSEPDRGEPLLCDGWVDGELELQEGALWLYGSGTAELEVEAPAPTVVSVYADARPVEPLLVGDRTTITVEIPNEGWHPFVVRAAPGLRLVAARFR